MLRAALQLQLGLDHPAQLLAAADAGAAGPAGLLAGSSVGQVAVVAAVVAAGVAA